MIKEQFLKLRILFLKLIHYYRSFVYVNNNIKITILRLFLMRIIVHFRFITNFLFLRKMNNLKRLQNIKKADEEYLQYKLKGFFINLEHRSDRLESILYELEKTNIKYLSRFEAIKNTNGALGCSLSHFELMSKWDATKDELLMLCEDDIKFIVSSAELSKLIQEFVNDPKADVLLLAANANIQHPYSDYFNIVLNSQTTAAYIVKPHMKNVLLENYQLSINLLEKGILSNIAAIDQIWKDLQVKFTFITPKEITVYQAESYSDIEKTTVNVGS